MAIADQSMVGAGPGSGGRAQALELREARMKSKEELGVWGM